jgi:hypothetical protein
MIDDYMMRAFSAYSLARTSSWGVAPGLNDCAPLALNANFAVSDAISVHAASVPLHHRQPISLTPDFSPVPAIPLDEKPFKRLLHYSVIIHLAEARC